MSSDYENIVRQCLKSGELWEDPEFPAVQGSVFYYQSAPFTFEWKRPLVGKFSLSLLDWILL
jgi:calpain-9